MCRCRNTVKPNFYAGLIDDGLQRDRRSEAIGIRLRKARNDRITCSLGRPTSSGRLPAKLPSNNKHPRGIVAALERTEPDADAEAPNAWAPLRQPAFRRPAGPRQREYPGDGVCCSSVREEHQKETHLSGN